jgi:hypothetical protein
VAGWPTAEGAPELFGLSKSQREGLDGRSASNKGLPIARENASILKSFELASPGGDSGLIAFAAFIKASILK